MEATETKPAGVYGAICDVMADLATEGVGKNQRNTEQNYQYRGIDDVYNALAKLLAKHRLACTFEVLAREVVEGKSKYGSTLWRVLLSVRYTLTFAGDGTSISTTLPGEAMDSADKATNKALSAAQKYFFLQTFCVPTVGDNDADATTHEPEPGSFQRPQSGKGKRPQPQRPQSDRRPDPPRNDHPSPDEPPSNERPPGDPPKAPTSKEITARAVHGIAEATTFQKLADIEDRLDQRMQERSLTAGDYDNLLTRLLERRVQIAAFPEEFTLAESQVASFLKRARISEAAAEAMSEALANKRSKHAIGPTGGEL